jgi:capsular exopolysaccharide synthesis family protein
MTPSDGTNNPLMFEPGHGHPTDQATPGDRLSLPGQSDQAGARTKGLPPALSSTPTVGALLLALQRRWLVATVLASLAAAAAVAGLATVLPAKYAAVARLELASRPARPFLTQYGGEVDVEPATYRANQLAIITSPLVLNSALNSDRLKGLKIAGQSAETLENAIKADFTKGPEIMTIKLSGEEPEHLADVLNAVVAAYIREIETRDNQRRDLGVSKLEKSLAENQQKLERLRQQLRDKEEEFEIPDLVTQQLKFNALTADISRADTDMHFLGSDLRKKRLDLKTKQARLKNIALEPVPQGDLKKTLDTAWSLQQFAIKLAEVDEEIASLSLFPDSDIRKNKLDGLLAKKEGIQDSAAKADAKLRPAAEKQLRVDVEEKLKQEIAALADYIAESEILESSLKSQMERKQTELKNLTNTGRKGSLVDQLRDEIKQTEKTQDTLAAQVALQKAEPPASAKIVVLQSAETPNTRDYSRFVKYGSGAAMGSFGLVLFGIAYLEFRLRKVNGPQEVIQGLGLPLIGTMPWLPDRARRPAQATATPREQQWQNIITESVDAIRTQLLHLARTDGLHVVMVTSAGGGEGKTSLASQLAASLARAWRKTLLVDADLRHPAAHKLFDLPLEPGFSEVLRGEANLQDVVKPTLLCRLWMMPAGHWDAHAVQALAQDEVRAKFTQMKEQYDFVIVDSCPVLPVADTLQLSQHVDGVVFSVLRDVSRLPSLYNAHQRLEGLGVRVLGAVVIGAGSDPGSLVYRYTSQAAT